MIGLCGLPLQAFPPLVCPNEIVGRITEEVSVLTGISQGVPVVNGTMDTVLENLSVGAINEDYCVIKIATASTVNIFGKKLKPCQGAITYSQIPEDLWSNCFPTSSAAESYRWYTNTFFSDDCIKSDDPRSIYQLFDIEASEIEPGCSGLIFHPYLMGERSPYWDPKLRGSFTGITAHHNRKHFSRAILEGVCYSIKDNFIIAQKIIPFSKVIIVGGGAKSKLWKQILSDVLNVPIVKYIQDDSSYGASMLAGIGIGVFSDYLDAINICSKQETWVQPNNHAADVYNKEFRNYKSIQECLQDIYREYE
jgi:xylulokinase